VKGFQSISGLIHFINGDQEPVSPVAVNVCGTDKVPVKEICFAWASM